MFVGFVGHGGGGGGWGREGSQENINDLKKKEVKPLGIISLTKPAAHRSVRAGAGAEICAWAVAFPVFNHAIRGGTNLSCAKFATLD